MATKAHTNPSSGVPEHGAADAAAQLERGATTFGVDRSQAVTAVDAAAEARVLSALFGSPALLDEVTEVLVPQDFGVPAHEVIFHAMLSCDASSRAIDPVTVADELTRSGELPRAGGVEGIRDIVTSPPVVEQFDAYVELIRDRATRRRLLAAARQIGVAALSGEADSQDLIGAAERAVFEVSEARSKSTVQTMPQVVAAVHARMAQARNSKMTGFSTGFEQLDKITGGLEPGQLVIIAGRPGSGKSVLASQISRHIAEVNDVTVPFLSYEMQAHDLGLRHLAAASGIPLSDLRRGYIPDGMDKVLAREAEKMAQLRLLIDDQPPPTFSGVRSAMRKLNRRVPLGALTVDYLQLMGAEKGVKEDNRAYVVGAISRGLKLLGDELKIPVIACSQLNRGVETRAGNGRPMLSDLRESGSLEQDAAIVILVHRPFLTNPDADPSEAELIVAKNRNGEAPYTIMAEWEGPQVRFKDTGRKYEAGARTGSALGAAANGGQQGGGFSGGGQPSAGGFSGGGFTGPKFVDPFGQY